MIKSMTGYGGVKLTAAEIEFSVELKSVNNRYLDTSVRMPRGYLFCEDTVKSAVSGHITRGKVDVFISAQSLAQDNMRVVVNEGLAAGYKAAVDRIADILGVESSISAYQIAQFPDVLTADKNEADKEKVQEALLEALEAALRDFDSMRVREGAKLETDISEKLDKIEKLVSFIEERSPQTVEEYREKLTRRMQEVLETTQIDEDRIITEAAIYADHISVDEETVRLRSHISQMRTLLAGGSPVGRKLDFLVQELNRETNTIGSKCNNSDITKAVLDIKSEIEKIREQVQNIE
ncbi:MAG: YicC family protein [Clostridiales bacterium]|nr:YicC family protein [Clostridiales bacterium]